MNKKTSWWTINHPTEVSLETPEQEISELTLTIYCYGEWRQFTGTLSPNASHKPVPWIQHRLLRMEVGSWTWKEEGLLDLLIYNRFIN